MARFEHSCFPCVKLFRGSYRISVGIRPAQDCNSEHRVATVAVQRVLLGANVCFWGSFAEWKRGSPGRLTTGTDENPSETWCDVQDRFFSLTGLSVSLAHLTASFSHALFPPGYFISCWSSPLLGQAHYYDILRKLFRMWTQPTVRLLKGGEGAPSYPKLCEEVL